MGAGTDYLRGPNWTNLHTAIGGHAFTLAGANAVAGPTPAMHFAFAGFFGFVWAFNPTPNPGTHVMAGSLTLTNTFTGCVITWPSRVFFDQEMEFDYMKNFVDEVDVPTNTVLRWEYPYTPLPWPRGEGCSRSSIIWTNRPRPRPIYKLNSQALPRYNTQSWRFQMP